MTEEEKKLKSILNYISATMYKDNITQNEFDRLEIKARKCLKMEKPEDAQAEIVYARLLYEEGKHLASRVQYNIAKRKRPDLATIYYGLYKNYVMEERWDEALENLQIYLSIMEPKKRVDGFNIILALLTNLLDGSGEYEIPLDIFLSQEIVDPKIGEMYEDLVDQIASELYATAVNTAESLEAYSRENHNYMEFITIKKILTTILRNINNDNFYLLRKNADQALENKDYKTLLGIVAEDANNFFRLLDITKYYPLLIENGYHKEIKEILNKREFDTASKKVKALYRKIIHEKEMLDNYTEEELAYYHSAIEAIENALLAEDYMGAYDMAKATLYKLSHPIFLYYMGLSAFHNESYNAAYNYFKDYNYRGGMKALESRFFMACCQKNIDRRKQFKECRRKYYIYTEFLKAEKHHNFLDYSYEPEEDPLDNLTLIKK